MKVKVNIWLILSAVLVAGVSAGGPSQCSVLSEKFRKTYELVIAESTADINAVQAHFDSFTYLCSSSIVSADHIGLIYSEFVYLSISSLTGLNPDEIIPAVLLGANPPPPLDCIISEVKDLISKIDGAVKNLRNHITTNCIPTALGPTSSCPEVVSYANDLQASLISMGIAAATRTLDSVNMARALGLGSIAVGRIQQYIGNFQTQFSLVIGELGNVDATQVLHFIQGARTSLPAPLNCVDSTVLEMYSRRRQLVDDFLKQISPV